MKLQLLLLMILSMNHSVDTKSNINKWETPSGYMIMQILSGRSNVFLLTDGKTNILIDTSTDSYWNKLVDTFDSHNLSKIDYLILTHTHHDHAANAKKVKDKYGAMVIVHKDEALRLFNGEAILPQGTNPFTRTLINLVGKKVESRFDYEPCSYDMEVDSIFSLKNIGFNAYLLHTPGHSSGSISLIIDDKIAIVGDTMFGILKNSVFPPYADNTKELVNSWEKLLSTGCVLFLPSHGSMKSETQLRNEYNKKTKFRIKR